MVQGHVLTLFDDHPAHNLHLEGGWWAVDCAGCGYTITASKDQGLAEGDARRIPCPICHPSEAA